MPINGNKNEEYLACPNCRSKELHAEQKGFSGGKALAGAIAIGEIGLLAGTIGSKQVNITCLKCGHRFKAGEALVIKPQVDLDVLEQQIVDLLRAGETVQAAKVYHDATNANLTQSLEYIDRVASQNDIVVKKDNKSNVPLIIGISLLVLVAAIYIILLSNVI